MKKIIVELTGLQAEMIMQAIEDHHTTIMEAQCCYPPEVIKEEINTFNEVKQLFNEILYDFKYDEREFCNI